jgi:glucuronate isomerase
LLEDIAAELAAAPVVDVHTHLRWEHPHAHSLAEIVFYHFITAELVAAGMPRDVLDLRDEGARLRAALPFIPLIRCGATHYCLRRILQDLYGMREEYLCEANLAAMMAAVAHTAQDVEWPRHVLRDRAHILHSFANIQPCHKWAERTQAGDGDLLRYRDIFVPSLEKGELIGADVRHLLRTVGYYSGMTVTDAASLSAAVAAFFSPFELDHLRVVLAWGATDMHYGYPTADAVTAAIRKAREGQLLAHAERNAVTLWSLQSLIAVLQPRHIPFQMFFGSYSAYPAPPVCQYDPRTLPQLTHLFSDYPDMQFDLLIGSENFVQEAHILTKMHGNCHVAGIWWHNMYPAYLRRIVAERLDVCPLNKVTAFFSDAYMTEWSYGKWCLVQREMAQVLAARVHEGYLSRADVSDVIHRWTWDNPRQLYRLGSSA